MSKLVPRRHQSYTELGSRVTTPVSRGTYAIRFPKPERDKQTKLDRYAQNRNTAPWREALTFVLRNTTPTDIYAIRKCEGAGCGALGCRVSQCIIRVHKSRSQFRTLCPEHAAGWVSR